MEDRRKFFRFESPFNVKYITEKGRTKGVSWTKNISKEGVAFRADRKLAKEDMLKMEFEIPGDNIPVFADGAVVWARKNKEAGEKESFDVGIKLIDITHFDRTRILEYAYKQWLKIKDAGKNR